MKRAIVRKGVGTPWPVMSAEEALSWLDERGISYEVCDTPVPVLANKVSCGVPLDPCEQVTDDYYYLPKSAVGFHPVVDIPATGDSMIDADIHEGDLLHLEVGALACDGDIVMAEIDNECTVKVLFTDEQHRKWLCPMNQRYSAIPLTGDVPVRITGVVRSIVKKTVRRSFSECAAIVSRTLTRHQRKTDVMQRVAEAVDSGSHLFWAASSWAVVYCVLRDCCGYEDSMRDFERRAVDLKLPPSFRYACALGTVQRTVSNHPYMRLHIDKWKDGGASQREVVLVDFLQKFLH